MPHVQPGAKACARRKAVADDNKAKSEANAQAREAFYAAMAETRRAKASGNVRRQVRCGNETP